MSVAATVVFEIDPRDAKIALLEAEIETYRLQFTAVEAMRRMERFHAFDAIKDDKCPSCGGRVRVKETGREVTLEAI